MTIKAFRESKELPAKRCNVFLELKNVSPKKKRKLIDVILMSPIVRALPIPLILLSCNFKLIQHNDELYTGPYARNIVNEPSSDAGKWRVFVLYKFEESMELNAGTEVLHQVGYSTYSSGMFD